MGYFLQAHSTASLYSFLPSFLFFFFLPSSHLISSSLFVHVSSMGRQETLIAKVRAVHIQKAFLMITIEIDDPSNMS